MLYLRQAKEYLANPEAFAVAAAPVAEEAPAAQEAPAAAAAAEEAEDSDGDMVSIRQKSIRSGTDCGCTGLRSV